ncbi:MAG: hypothetical protein IJB21_04130, partial [Bacilli bacterium]|nr:hypothetical protein [Bacilli bacterium]
VNDQFTELTPSNVDTIKYDGYDIKSSISELTVTTTSITKNGIQITPSDVTKTTGTVKINYQVSFTYSGNSVSKSFTQTISVTN